MSITAESMTPADIRACTSNNDGGMWGGDWLAYLLLFALIGGGGFGFGGFGGGGILPWLLFCNGSFGGGNGMGSPSGQGWATRADINEGFALNNLQGGQRDILGALTDGFHGVDNAVCQLGYNTQQGFNVAEMSRAQQQAAMMQQLSAMQFANQQCCCDELAAIKDVKYTIAQEECATRNLMQSNTRDIIDNQNSNARAILDAMNQNYIRTLENENQSLKLAASQSNQNAVLMAAMDANKAEILRKTGAECPTAAYIVQPPQPVTFPTNCCGTVNYANGGCGSF